MTPVYVNPPPSSFPADELKEEKAVVSLSGPTLFNTTQDQRGSKFGESHQHDQQASKHTLDGRSSDRKLLSSSSFGRAVTNDTSDARTLSSCKREDGDFEGSSDGSVTWTPSKMRLMQKMMNSNIPETAKQVKFTLKCQDHQHYQNNHINSSSNNSTIRVCSDCNTTTTPLWRSGPRGPKSLCNACGIRQRKARRAMEAAAAAANGTVIAMETSCTKTKVNNKEKKSRAGHVAQCKKLCKPPDPPQSQKKLCFKNLAVSLSRNSAFQGVFPQDVEEAAILLMELSCGLIHS